MAQTNDESWRDCSTCKKPIPFDGMYWVCNVSTCNRQRTGLVFCSVDCWDAHVPIMRHKDSWAEERQSPKRGQKQIKMESATKRTTAPKSSLKSAPSDDVLVVASKVKAYIKTRSDLNTSAGVMDALSNKIRALCDKAIRSAIKEERKTVLDRDVS